MAVKSLRIRLLAAAAIVVSLVLVLAGFALLVVFERNVVRSIDIELDAYLEQLASVLARDENGRVIVESELADPRFRQPYGGRYWQVSTDRGVVLRSRSLWDTLLQVDKAPKPDGGVQRRELAGPDRQVLYAAIRSVILEQESLDQREQAPPGPQDLAPSGSQEQTPTEPQGQTLSALQVQAPLMPQDERYILVAAMDRAEVDQINAKFSGDIVPALGIFAVLLIGAAWVQVSVGLAPLEKVRTGLEAVRLGESQRLDADVPSELQPLVAETNRLLEAQETALIKARARAGDLAHGIKTPLTALTMLAEGLRSDGQPGLAQDIEHHLLGLGRHVERELARSRIAAGAKSTRTLLEPTVSGLVKTISKFPRGEAIDWYVDSPAGLSAAVDEVDLAEILGNLLDNARKFTRSAVTVTARRRGPEIEVVVEDDGSGIPEHDRSRVLNRGIRLDERVPGSGLGLTIAKEIVEAYRGRLELGNSHTGGLRVILVLPAPDIRLDA
ncbi:MAG TPA: HAMP domain-containing sensor histidine kinase [Xanthobacteraceae bacterium]|nr:HAMP domain-containing sensor histidine kinase [Xanthobacteraceae bacterium]